MSESMELLVQDLLCNEGGTFAAYCLPSGLRILYGYHSPTGKTARWEEYLTRAGFFVRSVDGSVKDHRKEFIYMTEPPSHDVCWVPNSVAEILYKALTARNGSKPCPNESSFSSYPEERSHGPVLEKNLLI